MAANGTMDPVEKILIAIGMVREEIAALRADLTGSSAPISSSTAAAGQGKATSMSSRAPSDWRLFADRIRSLLQNAGYEGRALGPEAIQFASSLKEEEPDLSAWSDEEILARRAAWSPPTGESGAAAGKARKNPWQGLSANQSAERIAAMKAARTEKKAGESMPTAAGEAGEFKPVLIAGVRYFVNMETGHAYFRNEDGSPGEWAGMFQRSPKPHINTSVPEPLEGGKRKSTRKQKRKHKKTRKH